MDFTIGFDKADLKTLHDSWDRIISTNQWSHGYFTSLFEEKWSNLNNLPAVSFSSWTGGALSVLEYFNLSGKTVLCPSNTFMATPLSTINAGCKVEFVDCNRYDLCLSINDLSEKIDKYKPAAVWVVHIGGHIAFQIEEIAKLCKSKNIVLIEDCAHAHGAEWNGKLPGTWGDAGIYSFYATKTISTGEGGILVSNNNDLIEFAKKYKNYGRFDYDVKGVNFRISEFSAAIGCVQTDRLKDIVNWKNEYALKHLDPIYSNRVEFPDGMISGYYKYIIFDKIDNSTGKVYDELCHQIMKHKISLPNAEWVANNHWCAPLYYKGAEI